MIEFNMIVVGLNVIGFVILTSWCDTYIDNYLHFVGIGIADLIYMCKSQVEVKSLKGENGVTN